MKTISTIVLAGVLGLCALSASAEKALVKTVAAVHKEKAALSGKTVSVKGKVVKVNNGIMGRNFVHVQDGTGGPDSDRIIVTSKQTAQVGDQVTVTGLVTLDRDFGSGYGYPLLLEETSITK
jgi:DNA/RNA endonuclease YhcR with UshA esterase domain